MSGYTSPSERIDTFRSDVEKIYDRGIFVHIRPATESDVLFNRTSVIISKKLTDSLSNEQIGYLRDQLSEPQRSKINPDEHLFTEGDLQAMIKKLKTLADRYGFEITKGATEMFGGKYIAVVLVFKFFSLLKK